MRLYPALGSVMISAVLGACATQLDESGVPTDLESGPQGMAASTSSAGMSSTAGKGGSSSMAFGGSAGVGGKASGGSSSGSAGTAGVSSGGDAGSSDDGGEGGGSGSSTGGTGGTGGTGPTTSCTGLPTWTANAEPPNKPMLQGDELTYMGHKFAVEPANAMISWWNDVCPPSGTRAMWCEMDAQRYVDLGACE